MPFIVSADAAQNVPKAATNPERPVYPEDFTLADTEQTIPIATNQLEAVTIFVEASGAGDAEIWSRSNDDGTFFLLTSINFATDGQNSEQLNCPCGQIKVVNNGLTVIVVSVIGLPRNK